MVVKAISFNNEGSVMHLWLRHEKSPPSKYGWPDWTRIQVFLTNRLALSVSCAMACRTRNETIYCLLSTIHSFFIRLNDLKTSHISFKSSIHKNKIGKFSGVYCNKTFHVCDLWYTLHVFQISRKFVQYWGT